MRRWRKTTAKARKIGRHRLNNNNKKKKLAVQQQKRKRKIGKQNRAGCACNCKEKAVRNWKLCNGWMDNG
ncbi:putative spondin-1-like isoform X1 [Sesbania bispinosa]|nr:putative spondin-1-like isoform X1 [Sesbania bispinosa]